MDIRSISLRIVGPAALALVLGVAAPAHASPGSNLSGWGTRDWTTYHSTFIGSITEQADGSLEGYFTIVTHNDGEDPVVCRYLRFAANRGYGLSNFDGWGVCYTSSGTFAAHNRFAVSDLGSPGVGVDYIDVNYYGPVGVSIPGGYLTDGDLVYTP